MSPPPSRSKLIKAVLVSAACISVGSWIPRQLTLSPTNSLAQHLFYLNKDVQPSDIRSRDVVRFRLEDSVTTKASRSLQMDSAYLLKRVGCIQGQSLLVSPQKEYYCDGYYLGRAKDRSSAGKVVNNFVWSGDVPPGKFFAIADHIDSYDSRYFGFIDISRIEAKAHAIF